MRHPTSGTKQHPRSWTIFFLLPFRSAIMVQCSKCTRRLKSGRAVPLPLPSPKGSSNRYGIWKIM
jgi:hypothetical protein